MTNHLPAFGTRVRVTFGDSIIVGTISSVPAAGLVRIDTDGSGVTFAWVPTLATFETLARPLPTEDGVYARADVRADLHGATVVYSRVDGHWYSSFLDSAGPRTVDSLANYDLVRLVPEVTS